MSILAGSAQAQSNTVLSETRGGEFPILIRTAEGTMLRCRAGTNATNILSNLMCRDAETVLRETPVALGRGGFGNLGGPGLIAPLAAGLGGLVLLGLVGGSSGTSGT